MGQARDVMNAAGNRIGAGDMPGALEYYAKDVLVTAPGEETSRGIDGLVRYMQRLNSLMADGTYRNIEDVKAGDRVINMDGKPVRVVKAWCTGVREVMAVRRQEVLHPRRSLRIWCREHDSGPFEAA